MIKKNVLIISIIAASQILSVNMGCSVKKDYNTLSLFFDGVDTTAEMRSRQLEKTVQKTANVPKDSSLAKGIIYNHKVYNRKDCTKCHQFSSSKSLIQEEPELCYQCHDDYEVKYKKVHGPVAAGFCSSCHEHHKSKYRYLLKLPVREICQYCHIPGDVEKNKAHLNSSDTECVDCHNSHGGATLNMLKTKETH